MTSSDSAQLGLAWPQRPLNFRDPSALCMSVLPACVSAEVRTLEPLELEFWKVGAATWALGSVLSC